jgi:hypothetical protein
MKKILFYACNKPQEPILHSSPGGEEVKFIPKCPTGNNNTMAIVLKKIWINVSYLSHVRKCE